MPAEMDKDARMRTENTRRDGLDAGTMSAGLLAAVCIGHFLNDGIGSIIPAALPILRDAHGLTFAEVGLITLVVQITSSLLQPLVGFATDNRPTRFALSIGMCFTFAGLILLGTAASLTTILLSVALIGCGSAVFHPESARIAQHASGGRKGFAQAVFQVGGNAGMAVGPLAAAFVVVPCGQPSIAWFAPAAALAACLFIWVGRRGFAYSKSGAQDKTKAKTNSGTASPFGGKVLSGRALAVFFAILLLLMFSKQVYISTLQNFFTFYLIDAFGLSVEASQYALFGFLLMSALGTLAGGPLTDRFGRRVVILWSILGAAPFALLLPWAGLTGVISLALIVSFIMSSAFTAILVWALDAAPERIGMISGLFFGLSFGMGGLATAVFGWASDLYGLHAMFIGASVLPLMGLAAFALPPDGRTRAADGANSVGG